MIRTQRTVLAGMFLLPALFVAVIFQSGCRSTTYYQDRAVQRARQYALKELAGELTTEQREFIKFNKPQLLEAQILPDVPLGLQQTCITWELPGKQEACMIFGTSDRKLTDWSPNRIIWRDFSPWDQKRNRAIETARMYAINNLFFTLTPAQFNQVRFETPQIQNTNFDLISEYVGEMDDNTRKKVESSTQFAIIWPLADADLSVVVAGASAPDLDGWSVNFGAILSKEEVAQHTRNLQPETTLDAVEFISADEQSKPKN